MLLAALFTAAVYAGNLIFYPFLGQRYGNAAKSCLAQAADLPEHEAATRYFACIALTDVERTLFAFGFGLAVAALGWVLLRRLPQRVYRRAGRVRAAGQHRQDEAVAAIQAMGGRVVPCVEFASASREAFTVRIEGRIRIVLPNGVLRLPRDEASALLRHECAHVVAGDVGRVWLTRGVWWATPVVLILPLLVDVGRVLVLSDKTFADVVLTGFNRDYVIRAAALLGLVWLVSRSVLRSREHHADLLSSRSPSGEAFIRPLRSLLERGREEPGSRLRALAALHPSPRRRRDVLQHGAMQHRSRAVEGFAFGTAAGIVQPTLAFFIWPIVSPIADLRWTTLAAVLVPGVLLGYAWGTTIWRSHAVDDPRPWAHRALSASGLPLGAVVGLALSMTATGSAWVDSATLWFWGFSAASLVGAAVLCGGIATLWSRHRPRPTSWWTGLIAAFLFAGAIELIHAFQAAVELGDWALVWTSLTTQPWWALVTGQAAVAVAAWLIADGARLRLLLFSTVMSMVVAIPRLLLAQTVTLENAQDHLTLDARLAMAAGLAAFMVCAVTGGRRGIAWGVGSAWFTALLTSTVMTLKYNHPLEMLEFSVLPAAGNLAPTLLILSALTVMLPLRPSAVQKPSQ